MSDNDKVVVGIHSQVGPNTEGSVNQLVDGHSWISVTRNGQTEYYGLWPDSHLRGLDNGAASDIRRGIEGEAGFRPNASRYYELTPEQATALEGRLRENVTWGYGNTCASWASDTVSRVTGQNIDASELLGLTDTPRELINCIRELEQQRRTSPSNPITPAEIPQRSSSFSALDRNDPMTQQAEVAVRGERARLGLPEGDVSNEVAYAVRLAKENNLPGIANIRYPDRGDGSVFVQGTGNDPGARAHAMFGEFTQTPASVSIAALNERTAAIAPSADAAELADPQKLAPRVQSA